MSKTTRHPRPGTGRGLEHEIYLLRLNILEMKRDLAAVMRDLGIKHKPKPRAKKSDKEE